MDRFPHRNREELEANDVLDFDPQEEKHGSDDAMDVAMSVNGDDETSSNNEDSDDAASDDDESMSSADDSNKDYDDDILERLEQDDPNLTKICLTSQDENNVLVKWFPTTNAEWSDMGCMLGNNTHVVELDIVNNYYGEAISEADERALYAGLQHNRSIQNLYFAGPLPAIFTSFVNPSNKFWEANKNLVRLSLNGLYDVGRREMRQLCSVIIALKNLAELQFSHSIDSDNEDEHYLCSILARTLGNMEYHSISLKSLKLHGNAIGTASVKNIVRTIQRCCPDLEELNLQDISSIGYDCCETIASLLRRPSSRLTSLDLWSCSIDDRCALLLADALKRNTSLRTMILEENNITAEGWKAFSTLVCNKSSLTETVTSNHMLEDLGEIDEPLVRLLALNYYFDDKRAVAMIKAIKFHLSELVVTMGVKLLPIIMACIGADEDLLAEMFSIVRSSPILFQYAA